MKSCLAIIGVGFIALVIWLSLSEPAPTTNPQPSKLDNCLSEAEASFDRVFRLNSNESTKNDGARTWSSKESKDTAYSRLDADRKLCIDLYKD